MDELIPPVAPATALQGEVVDEDDALVIPAVFRKVSHPKKREFLLAMCLTPSTRVACSVVGITDRTVWNWRNRAKNDNDTAFLEAYEVARQLGIEAAENEAWERAHDGWDEPVFGNISEPTEILKADGKGTRLAYVHRTGIVGHIKKKSDTLLIFMLKGAKPEVYRERYEHSGPNGLPLQLQIVLPDNGRRRLSESGT